MTVCRGCRDGAVEGMLALADLPVCSHYKGDPLADERLFPFAVGVCSRCGLVQLTEPFPEEVLEPPYAWIRYNEPEGHLDEVAAWIALDLACKRDAQIFGVTFKDDTLLERMRRLGFEKVHRFSPAEDYGLSVEPGVETVQRLLTPAFARDVVARRGRCSLLVVRHVFEHVYNYDTFVEALRILLEPGGIVLVELPDCTPALALCDVETLWEEHLHYYTPATFRAWCDARPVELHTLRSFAYPVEHVMVAALQLEGTSTPSPSDAAALASEIERAQGFAEGVAWQRSLVRQYLMARRAEGGRLAVFGAGHTACLMINAFDLGSLLDVVIDDDPNKRGLFMPGSGLEIVASDELVQRGIQWCIFSINPLAEDKVEGLNQAFFDAGGRFLSFCPVSPRFIGRVAQQCAPEERVVNPEVAYSSSPVTRLTERDLAPLKDRALRSAGRRSRLCVHEDEHAPVHEMMIALDQSNYIRPHRHLRKSESLHVVEGEADLVLFDEDGGMVEMIRLGPSGSGGTFFFHMKSAIYHAFLIRTPTFVFHEVTKGPLNRSETEYAPWAPAEDAAGARAYAESLRSRALAHVNEQSDGGAACDIV